MDLLKNELIRKYFGLEKTCWRESSENYQAYMSLKILRAMQEQIRTGELALNYEGGKIQEWQSRSNVTIEGFHPSLIRLPDAHQKKEYGTSAPEATIKLQKVDNALRNICVNFGVTMEQLHNWTQPSAPETNPLVSPCIPAHALYATCDQCRPSPKICRQCVYPDEKGIHTCQASLDQKVEEYIEYIMRCGASDRIKPLLQELVKIAKKTHV